MRTVIIHNPGAGTQYHTALAQAERVLAQAGLEVTIKETRAPGEATELAHAAAMQGADMILAAGGDGTLNEVANGTWQTRAALGVLPIGTANVWAKEMGLPLNDLATAARMQLDAPVREIDVGIVSRENLAPRIFLLWCGIGYDALITHEIERDPQTKRRFGALLFWLVGFRTALEYRGQRAVFLLDGQKQGGRLMFTLISNIQLYGGLVRIAANAKLDDGELDVTMFHGAGIWRATWHLVRVFTRRHLREPDITHTRAKTIEIRAKHLPMHVDGEPIGEAPAQIRLIPRALRVLVPLQANAALFAGGNSYDQIETARAHSPL